MLVVFRGSLLGTDWEPPTTYHHKATQLSDLHFTAPRSFNFLCSKRFLTSQNCIPLALFPTLSSGGDQHITPMTLGTTSSMAPDTPDLAGSPTWKRAAGGRVTLGQSQTGSAESEERRLLLVSRSHGKPSGQRSRTFRRSTWDSGCCAPPPSSGCARPWLGRSPRWPGWPPWCCPTRRWPQWNRAETRGLVVKQHNRPNNNDEDDSDDSGCTGINIGIGYQVCS